MLLNKIKSFLLWLLALLLGLFGLSLLTRTDKEKLKKAKENIKKAGEHIEAEYFDDADSAAQYIDDILSRIDGRGPVSKHREN